MKKIPLIVMCSLFLLFIQAEMFSQNIKVMTLNIRYDNPGDGKNIWENRKCDLVKLLDYYHTDFIGLQEALNGQLVYIHNGLNNYNYIGIGREDGKEKGEYAPIFYNTEKYDLVKQSTFWLSEQPDKVSKGWDAACERICTYGLFKDKQTKKLIYVFNTHFDHIGTTARMNSAKLILKKIEELVKDKTPIVFMGDLNCTSNENPIKILRDKLDYGAELSPKGVYGPKGTFSGFDEKIEINETIDYLFVKNVSVINYRHIDDKLPNNNFISDHYPVMIEFKRK